MHDEHRHTWFFVDRHLSSWERFLSEHHWDLSGVLTCQVGKTLDLTVVVREMWIRDLTQKVRIVVVEGLKDPLICLSTDLRLSAKPIIEI